MQHQMTPLIYLSEVFDPVIATVTEKLNSHFDLRYLSKYEELSKILSDLPNSILLCDEKNVDWIANQLKSNKENIFNDQLSLIVISNDTAAFLNKFNDGNPPFFINFLQLPLDATQAALALINARKHLLNQNEVYQLKQKLQSQNQELRQLNEIGIALSAERDPEALLDMILNKSREITNSDAGSLYLVEIKSDVEEDAKNYFANKQLRFKLAQNDSVKISFKESVMPIEKKSVAGYVALTNNFLNISDVYTLSADSQFSHNRSFDHSTGYRTKSMLVIPMKNHKDEIIGVLQLINRKKNWDARLSSTADIDLQVIPFDTKCVDLASSLASQAAISIENNRLYEDIKELFEGFIRASVLAIEQRDPTTFGHSERVAALTTAIAEKVDSIDSGIFRNIKFSREQVQQIKYAALLHDFGKIGVREDVLVKAKKLFPHELDAVKNRFQILKKATQLDYTQEKINTLLQVDKKIALVQISLWDQKAQEKIADLDRYLQLIYALNEPSVMKRDDIQLLEQISEIVFEENGRPERLLKSREIEALSIPKGSLSQEERIEIESHVNHTFNFLSKIPWTSELKHVPQIAHAHHEKLDGSGYPLGLNSDQIPIESKMMAIADIYDALTAWDRPYKRAVPVEKALQILQWEVNDGKIDRDLYQVFVDARIYDIVKKNEN
ncbi:MAG: GAF domain-containing protein [bacterium]|nr:GAF domain-containing protein [bacterium]